MNCNHEGKGKGAARLKTCQCCLPSGIVAYKFSAYSLKVAILISFRGILNLHFSSPYKQEAAILNRWPDISQRSLSNALSVKFLGTLFLSPNHSKFP
jgi:hypothetical protein